MHLNLAQIKVQEEVIASLCEEKYRLAQEKLLLREENRLLQEQIRFLNEKVAELERRLTLNSTTSSKPPSSDGLAKQKRKPLSSRGKGKPKGGQKGHQGKTMQQSPNPDKVILHQVHTCCQCGADLEVQPTIDTVKRQVFDVTIQRIITEHQAQIKRCSCKVSTTAPFPPEVKAPVQIGDTLRSIALYLSEQFIAKDRLSQVIEDLFSISVSDTTLLNYEEKLAENLKPFVQDSLTYLRENAVKHGDETGIRVGGKTQWMHTLCDPFVTYLYHQPGRKCYLTGLKGIFVHDHYRSYLDLPLTHAFCNAHILRELKALIKYDKELWAEEMSHLLRLMNQQKDSGRLEAKKIAYFEKLYDKIIERGFYYHQNLPPLPKPARGRSKRRTGHNLLIRLREFKTGILLFLRREEVPFTNNEAERALRMVKVKQKVSGCFRTVVGVENFARIRSYIATVKKNGGNIFEAIKIALRREIHLFEIFNPFKMTQLALPPPS